MPALSFRGITADLRGPSRPPRTDDPAMIRSDILAAIGGTPLIRLKRASEETGCTILGKAEFMNPGG